MTSADVTIAGIQHALSMKTVLNSDTDDDQIQVRSVFLSRPLANHCQNIFKKKDDKEYLISILKAQFLQKVSDAKKTESFSGSALNRIPNYMNFSWKFSC